MTSCTFRLLLHYGIDMDHMVIKWSCCWSVAALCTGRSIVSFDRGRFVSIYNMSHCFQSSFSTCYVCACPLQNDRKWQEQGIASQPSMSMPSL